MSKRNQIVRESKKSKALKAFRIKSGLSLRKLADKMNLSFTRVHQMESGKDDVSDNYISLFLEAICVSRDQWDNELGYERTCSPVREECYQLLERISDDNLPIVFGILKNFI